MPTKKKDPWWAIARGDSLPQDLSKLSPEQEEHLLVRQALEKHFAEETLNAPVSADAFVQPHERSWLTSTQLEPALQDLVDAARMRVADWRKGQGAVAADPSKLIEEVNRLRKKHERRPPLPDGVFGKPGSAMHEWASRYHLDPQDPTLLTHCAVERCDPDGPKFDDSTLRFYARVTILTPAEAERFCSAYGHLYPADLAFRGGLRSLLADNANSHVRMFYFGIVLGREPMSRLMEDLSSSSRHAREEHKGGRWRKVEQVYRVLEEMGIGEHSGERSPASRLCLATLSLTDACPRQRYFSPTSRGTSRATSSPARLVYQRFSACHMSSTRNPR